MSDSGTNVASPASTHDPMGTAKASAAGTSTAVVCPVCPRHCRLHEGELGLCRARRCVGGIVVDENYGRLTSIAMDPIEKKPIAEWHPGGTVLSVGSYGCNLHCPFCQNWEISQADPDDHGAAGKSTTAGHGTVAVDDPHGNGSRAMPWHEVAPEELAALAMEACREDSRMLGVAYTYNEPLVGWEYVRDTARLMHAAGLANVFVSNGCAAEPVIDELAPLVDAANIDLKSFSPDFYRTCGGDLDQVKRTIVRLASEPGCHLEVTTLVVTDANDSETEMEAIASWLTSVDPGIVLHVTRFFPRWRMQNRGPTPVDRIYRLAEVARRHLPHVHVGNC